MWWTPSRPEQGRALHVCADNLSHFTQECVCVSVVGGLSPVSIRRPVGGGRWHAANRRWPVVGGQQQVASDRRPAGGSRNLAVSARRSGGGQSQAATGRLPVKHDHSRRLVGGQGEAVLRRRPLQ